MQTPYARCRLLGTIVVCLCLLATDKLTDAAETETATSFSALRRQHAEAMFDAVARYITDNPQADDVREASLSLFETALEHDLVREAKPVAERFLTENPDASVREKSLARRVAMLALALEGEADAAIDVFAAELVVVRRLDPSSAVETATILAAAVQRGGKPEAAKQVYERLERAFLLNAGVGAIVENRLARLALLGEPAPPIRATDLNGQPVAPDNFAGKIVLIDFWATNCPPCLEELPQLRRLHADLEGRGFELLAVSLDEDEDTLRQFVDRAELPWRVFLSTTDDGVREAYRVETIPANFLVGPDGKVVCVDLHGNDLRAEVERLLNARK